jgi:hypothetical protein
MAKHVMNPIDQLQVPLIRSMQERLAKMHGHANYKPEHDAGTRARGEGEAEIDHWIAQDNARQNAFYETHDRTEDARPY